MPDIDTDTANLVTHAAGVTALVEKDDEIGRMRLGSASVLNSGTDEGDVPVLGAGGKLHVDTIPDGVGGGGSGLPTLGDAGDFLIVNEAGDAAEFSALLGAKIVEILDNMTDGAKHDLLIKLLAGLGANDILQINGDGDAIEALDADTLTFSAKRFFYSDDIADPTEVSITEMAALLAEESEMVVAVGDGSLTLTYIPHITDVSGVSVEMISSVTFNAPTGFRPGACFLVYFTQDGTGSLTLSAGSGVSFATGWDGSLNDGPDEVTAVVARCLPDGSTVLELGETLT